MLEWIIYFFMKCQFIVLFNNKIVNYVYLFGLCFFYMDQVDNICFLGIYNVIIYIEQNIKIRKWKNRVYYK